MRIDLLTSKVVKPEAENTASASKGAPQVEAHDRAVEEPVVQEPTSVAAAARQIEAYLEKAGRALEFRVDAETNRTVVTVRDTSSGEVIRQIPGDEVLHLARRLAAGMGGLVDLKV